MPDSASSSESPANPLLRPTKFYFALGGFRSDVKVFVGHDHRAYVPEPLHHRLRHSPDGFSWGYGGSGPSDLARSILWDVFDEAPTNWLYIAFKNDVIARLDQNKGWVITEADIRKWVYGHGGWRSEAG
jgi:hypothetical protein